MPHRLHRPLQAQLPAWPLARLTGLMLAGLALSAPASAIDFGPVSLNGFVKIEGVRATNVCVDCQRFPAENRQRPWADEVVPGRDFYTDNSKVVLAQPYLGLKFDLPAGFQVGALFSQRWRDGSVDLPGFWYERNMFVSHEDYGRLTIGAFPTRAWSFADYPFGSDFGGGDIWASSGAGYGMNTHALRYTSRTLDVNDGDLVLELTYDQGDTDFKVNKPHFVELWSRYYKGDLKLDVMFQATRNGGPNSWGHAPFAGITFEEAYDSKVGGSGQSIVMAMARYQLNSNFELGAGIRFNRWSGAYGVCVDFVDGQCRWNNFFNTDFGGKDVNGVANPGYEATSTDYTLGLRYVTGPWSVNTGVTYLSEAKTDNPKERGQSNTLTKLTLGGAYDFKNGLSIYTSVSTASYGQAPQSSGCAIPLDSRPAGSCTLAPLSAPATNWGGSDPRVSRTSNAVTFGATYSF
jgi:predicted porin